MNNIDFDILVETLPEGKKIIGELLFEMIGYSIVRRETFYKFNKSISDENVLEFIKFMQKSNMLTRFDIFANGYKLIPRKIEDIDPKLIRFMTDAGHNTKAIENRLSELFPFEKANVSNILENTKNFDWMDIDEVKPPTNTAVAVRMCCRYKFYENTEKEVLIAEDLKIAKFNGSNWEILPPFPLYDYSPLSDKEKFKDGVEVSHWSSVTDEEMDGWKTRFDPIGTYKHLSISVDKEHEEIVYKALLRASSFFRSALDSKYAPPEIIKEATQFMNVMNDLQSCMDKGRAISNWRLNENDIY